MFCCNYELSWAEVGSKPGKTDDNSTEIRIVTSEWPMNLNDQETIIVHIRVQQDHSELLFLDSFLQHSKMLSYTSSYTAALSKFNTNWTWTASIIL